MKVCDVCLKSPIIITVGEDSRLTRDVDFCGFECLFTWAVKRKIHMHGRERTEERVRVIGESP